MFRIISLILFLTSAVLFSQDASPFLEITDNEGRDNILIDCDYPLDADRCFTLKANFTTIYETTDYIVESIPFTPPTDLANGTTVEILEDDKWGEVLPLPDLGAIKVKDMAAHFPDNIWIAHQGVNFNSGQGEQERIKSNRNIRNYAPDRDRNASEPKEVFERDGLGGLHSNSITVDKNNSPWTINRNHNATILGDFIFTPRDIAFKDQNQSTKKKFRLSLSAGYGYRTAPANDSVAINNTATDFKDYLKALKSGRNLEAHLSYFIGENWALGITYNNFSSKGEITFSNFVNAPESYSDKINITFIAPEYLYRLISSNKKHGLILASSIGYLNYNHESTFININKTYKGGSLGLGIGVQYDYYLTPSIALGTGVNYIAGSLRKATISVYGQSEEVTLEDNEIDNLSQININGGIRFFF